LLWRELRRAFPAAKFRRQTPVGPSFADFLSFRHKLVIEVDGGQHALAGGQDAVRTALIESKGFRVIRFWNHEVLSNPAGVLQAIGAQLGSAD
jgi:very-short-patch-repair endonuclease